MLWDLYLPLPGLVAVSPVHCPNGGLLIGQMLVCRYTHISKEALGVSTEALRLVCHSIISTCLSVKCGHRKGDIDGAAWYLGYHTPMTTPPVRHTFHILPDSDLDPTQRDNF